MENAKKFFEEIIRTEEAKAAFYAFEKPESEDETIRIYSEVAKKFGIELSEEEIRAYLSEKTVKNELDDEELSQLSGGVDHKECKNTFKDKENCWWNDACDLINSSYDEYLCKRNNTGASSFYNWDM